MARITLFTQVIQKLPKVYVWINEPFTPPPETENDT